MKIIINPEIEINEDFEKALDLLENSNKTVFITGKAGTGKSTLLTYFIKNSKKKVVVLAPTGVAALNVKGQTIHSFFKFKPTTTIFQIKSKKKSDKKLREILSNLDTIIIDEISMVRSDLLDQIDASMKKILGNSFPFGGKQMVFIGDLYQLPPVVSGIAEKELFSTYYQSPYFFDAKIMQDIELEILELEKVYRQKDDVFINILNKIRNNTIDDDDLEKLNERHYIDAGFYDEDKFFITLTTTNAVADRINEEKLKQIEGQKKVYLGEVTGEFDGKSLPTAQELSLKKGAQIMMLNNDTSGRWVNGSVGKILDMFYDEEQETDVLEVQLQDSTIVYVEPYSWELYRYFYDSKESKLDVDKIGSFKQYPLRLAWAVTIHKSQGKTFDNVIVDIGNGAFAQGQVYVAISRSTSFEGLLLKRPIEKRHIWTDYRIINFLTGFQYQKSEKLMSIDLKMERIARAIKDNETLEIVYLKADDTKSQREIMPFKMGEMEYLKKKFLGLEAKCLSKNDRRCFRIDRILEIKN